MRVLTEGCRVYSLSRETPVAYVVEPGEVFVVETADAMDGQIPAQGACVAEVDATRANPMTGPIRVTGVQPGQTVAVRILDIDVGAQGWMSRSPAGLLNEVENNLVHFAPGVCLAIRPMVGVLGVAPAVGSYTGKDAGRFGGNLDIKELQAGATLFMVAQVEGGGLVAGDVHALQADGESSGTGVEIGARITMGVEVLSEGLSDWPYFCRDGVLSTVGAAQDLSDACELAVAKLARMVGVASGMDEPRTRMFLSLVADVHVGQYVCPVKTAYASLDLRACPWPIALGIQA